MARTDISYQNLASDQNQHSRLGHPGKYIQVLETNGAANHTLDLTGSNYGYGAVSITTAGDLELKLSGGGTIPASNLNTKEIYDLSVLQISGSSGQAFVYKRQQ